MHPDAEYARGISLLLLARSVRPWAYRVQTAYLMDAIEITFPGGKMVDAQVGPFVVRTDQPTASGGGATAPAPFDLFLAAVGTCAGFYVLEFCLARGLSTEGLRLRQEVDVDPETHLSTSIRLTLTLPPGFPAKYHAAIVRAAESCKVKKTIAASPPIVVTLATEAPGS